MGFMDQAKDMYRLQKQAKQIKKELKRIQVEAEQDGVKVTVDGEQNIVDCVIAETAAGDVKKMAKSFVEAANRAIKKSQMIGAEKMKEVMGSSGFGGMFGGK